MTHFSCNYYETQYDIRLYYYKQEDAPVSFCNMGCSLIVA